MAVQVKAQRMPLLLQLALSAEPASEAAVGLQLLPQKVRQPSQQVHGQHPCLYPQHEQLRGSPGQGQQMQPRQLIPLQRSWPRWSGQDHGLEVHLDSSFAAPAHAMGSQCYAGAWRSCNGTAQDNMPVGGQ